MYIQILKADFLIIVLQSLCKNDFHSFRNAVLRYQLPATSDIRFCFSLLTRCWLNYKTTNPLIVVTNQCMRMEKKKTGANGKTQECFSDLSSTSLQHVLFLCISFCIMDLVTDQWVGLVTLNVSWPVSCCRFGTFPCSNLHSHSPLTLALFGWDSFSQRRLGSFLFYRTYLCFSSAFLTTSQYRLNQYIQSLIFHIDNCSKIVVW